MGLFSKKKKDADQNPYAEQPFSNPMTPYQQARNNLAQGQPPVAGLPSSTAPPSYHSPAPSYHSPAMSTASGFGNDQYGNQNGYGADRYGSNSASPAPRGGGYGGFDGDAGKSDLLGGASGRYVPPKQNGASPAASGPGPAGVNRNPALYGDAQNRYNPVPASKPQSGAADDEYGGYGAPRELTAEEQEAQDVQNIHDETSQVRDDTLATTGRINALGNGIVAQMSVTMARLGEQGERMQRTERMLDEAAIHAKDSADKTKELKKLNGSMFVPVNGNAFTRKKREQAKDAAVLARHQQEKEIRSQTLHEGYRANQMVEGGFNQLEQPRQKLLGTSNTTTSKKFTFVDDGEAPEEMEKEEAINEGVKNAAFLVETMKEGAQALGRVIDQQTDKTGRIIEKSDALDDRVRMNREKLSRIR